MNKPPTPINRASVLEEGVNSAGGEEEEKGWEDFFLLELEKDIEIEDIEGRGGKGPDFTGLEAAMVQTKISPPAKREAFCAQESPGRYTLSTV